MEIRQKHTISVKFTNLQSKEEDSNIQNNQSSVKGVVHTQIAYCQKVHTSRIEIV